MVQSEQCWTCLKAQDLCFPVIPTTLDSQVHRYLRVHQGGSPLSQKLDTLHHHLLQQSFQNGGQNLYPPFSSLASISPQVLSQVFGQPHYLSQWTKIDSWGWCKQTHVFIQRRCQKDTQLLERITKVLTASLSKITDFCLSERSSFCRRFSCNWLITCTAECPSYITSYKRKGFINHITQTGFVLPELTSQLNSIQCF